MDSNDIKTSIDFDKVAEYRKSMGYYQIVASELAMEPLEVIDKYHGLTQIEDQFRVMKGDLETRPLYVRFQRCFCSCRCILEQRAERRTHPDSPEQMESR